jgi:alkylated DNA repair dioxygenase AlkB
MRSTNLAYEVNTGPDLFGSSDDPMIVEGDSLSLKLWPNFVPIAERAELLQALINETPWRETELHMYGRRVKMPRLTCWYGEPDAVYTYSGIKNEPLPWTQRLIALRDKVRRITATTFNSSLLNFYRDGNDYMSWHSDDEKELGSAPAIASVSLGATRRFDFRRANAEERSVHTTRSIELTDGSLLLMTGNTQRDWQHGIPKASRIREPRINLTFRYVQTQSNRAR